MNEKVLWVNEARNKWWAYRMSGSEWKRDEATRGIIADNYMEAAKKLIDMSGEKLDTLQYCSHRHGNSSVRAIMLELGR